MKLKSIARGAVAFGFFGLLGLAHGWSDEPKKAARDFDLQSIVSLDEVNGDWEIAPEGVGLCEGDSMVFDHGRRRYSQYTCARPPALKEPIEFDISLERGALVLETDNPHVRARKWHLAKLGEHRCLVCLTTTDDAPIRADAMVFYHRPNAKKELPTRANDPANPVGTTFKKRFPPKRE